MAPTVPRLTIGLMVARRPRKFADAARFSPWFRAAAAYNLGWSAVNLLWPRQMLRLLGHECGDPLAWQLAAMLVGVYGPAYWWASRFPERHAHVIAVSMLGKILGPAGFGLSVTRGRLPLRFGVAILLNDLIWWPAFSRYLREAAAASGGWPAFLSGHGPASAG